MPAETFSCSSLNEIGLSEVEGRRSRPPVVRHAGESWGGLGFVAT
jgi:hypothetical protein